MATLRSGQPVVEKMAFWHETSIFISRRSLCKDRSKPYQTL